MPKPKSEFAGACRFLLSAFCFLLAAPRASLAHPMGNFSISHYSGIRIEAGSVELRYILDMAEIPTFQVIQETGMVAQANDPSVEAYLAREVELLKAGLVLQVNGQPTVLQAVSHDVLFTPGAGGLPTMKIGFVYRAALPPGLAAAPCSLAYRDNNFAGRAGWKEAVATGDPGVTFQSSSAPATSRSQQLANYPADLLNSPPQDLEARVSFSVPGAGLCGSGFAVRGVGSVPGGQSQGLEISPGKSRAVDAQKSRRRQGKGAAAAGSATRTASQALVRSAPETRSLVPAMPLRPNQRPTPRNRFTQLVTSQQWGFWFLFTAAFIAAGLGGLHALEPGHGKTLVAAYLVGSKSKAAHAFILGLMVTITHTAGVYALGIITLYASKYVVPDHLYPWLGVGSGLTIAGLGFWMLLRRSAGHTHGHSHDRGHEHSHHQGHEHGPGHGHMHEHEHSSEGGGHHERGHEHAHGHAHSHGGSYRGLVTLGVTGGILPCPAALVVLLSAISLHRIGFGLFLIVAFSFGLAAVLIAVGLLTVFAGRLMASRLEGQGALLNRWLPMASAAVITVLGMAIAVKALMTGGIVQIRL